MLTNVDVPSGRRNTYAGCHGTLNRAQIYPSASLRLVKFRLYFDTKPSICPTSERAATQTKVTFGFAAAT